MELVKNGSAPQPGMVTTSWQREDLSNGRKRFKLYAVQTPLQQAASADLQLAVSHPRLAGPPMVIAEMMMEVPSLDVAKMLYAGLGDMLSKQPPEILQARAL